jgi:NAD(P)H-flavin reductase
MSRALSYLRTAFQLKLGLANPCTSFLYLDRIAAKHSLLTPTTNTIHATFMQKQKINRNTYLLRLGKETDNIALPDPDKCLGLMIGQFIRINIKGKSRPYNPISRIDEPGIIDLFVRDMRP